MPPSIPFNPKSNPWIALLEAAKLTCDCFYRASLNEDNYLHDDEHEAWTALNAAIRRIDEAERRG